MGRENPGGNCAKAKAERQQNVDRRTPPCASLRQSRRLEAEGRDGRVAANDAIERKRPDLRPVQMAPRLYRDEHHPDGECASHVHRHCAPGEGCAEGSRHRARYEEPGNTTNCATKGDPGKQRKHISHRLGTTSEKSPGRTVHWISAAGQSCIGSRPSRSVVESAGLTSCVVHQKRRSVCSTERGRQWRSRRRLLPSGKSTGRRSHPTDRLQSRWRPEARPRSQG